MMHTYDKHVGDYIRDTVGLSMTEDGAYNRLLDQYYLRELPLPLDHRELYRLARCQLPAERKAVDYIIGRYFDRTDDGYVQKRCEQNIAAYHGKSHKAAEASRTRWERERKRKADAMRTHSDGTPDAMRTGMRTRCEPDAIHLPPTINPVPHPSDASLGLEPQALKDQTPQPPAVASTRASSVALPEWLDRAAWRDYIAHRKAKRATMTDRALELCVMKLEALRHGGDNPTEVLNQSIANGWTSLQPLPRKPGPRIVSRAGEMTAQAAANVIGRMRDQEVKP